MHHIHKFWQRAALVALLYGGATGMAGAVITSFSSDVNTAINSGLEWLNTNGAYANPSSAGDATGLTTLALLEKRVSADPASLSQGYSLANLADQGRMRLAVAAILTRIDDFGSYTDGFYAYKDGGDLMALSAYLLTAGPDRDAVGFPELAGLPYDLIGAINRIVDRAKLAQDGNILGYWCYTDGGCNDSSTTQLTVSGLLAAKGVYSNPAWVDAARLLTVNAMLAKVGAAYASIPAEGGALTPTELGHGYNRGDTNSLQQTASGTWIQLAGGANVNDPGVQHYLEWLRNRYGYSAGNSNANGGWDISSYYYLWSFSKALQFIADSGVAPSVGNLGPDDIGILPAASAPAFAAREVHLIPGAVARPALFGGNAAPYYSDPAEPPRVYFDMAYTLLTQQLPSGQFLGFGRWNDYSAQAYSLLVLTRSVGGGCLDGDGDGLCDSVDNCPAVANAGQEDTDTDTVGNVCDNCPTTANPGQEDDDDDTIGNACEAPPFKACDADRDGDIDRIDLGLISSARGLIVPLSPPDPRDAVANGIIDLADVRFCTRKLGQ